MKTTIELPQPLFLQAKQYAAARNMSLKALIEQGLHRVMAEGKEVVPFVLRDGSVDGDGLASEFRNVPWEKISGALYEGRGG